MGLIDNPLASVLEKVLAYHSRRHDVIASNIANANTPGYTAFDLVLRQRLDQASPLEIRTSDPRHMTSSEGTNETGSTLVKSRNPAGLDANNVSLEQEFLKLSENQMLYQVGFELMDKWGNLNPVARDTQ